MLRKNACSHFNNISKTSVKIMTSPGILDDIPLAQWQVTSFDPLTRQVCVDYDNGYQIIHLSFVLPSLR